jgi:hypothetical protein
MYYIAAFDELARISFLQALGSRGFDTALNAMGTLVGLDNMTCYHMAFMGISECGSGKMHANILREGAEKTFNFIWPMLLVDGSQTELEIQSDDANLVERLKYEKDVAYMMGKYAYH